MLNGVHAVSGIGLRLRVTVTGSKCIAIAKIPVPGIDGRRAAIGGNIAEADGTSFAGGCRCGRKIGGWLIKNYDWFDGVTHATFGRNDLQSNILAAGGADQRCRVLQSRRNGPRECPVPLGDIKTIGR